MAHRRGGFRGRSGGISESQRRKKSWLGFADTGNIATGNILEVASLVGAGSALAVKGITSADAGVIGLLEGTIMRIRGSVEVPKSTGTVGPVNMHTVAFGIGFVTDEAFQAAAVPNPATAGGADWDGWLFYRSQLQGSLDANAGVVDSKAMRKWQSGTSLVLVAGQASDAPESAVTIVALFRSLFLLP